MKNKAVTMMAIAAVFGGISIFAADWWIKNAANERVDRMSASLKAEKQPEVEFKTIVVAKERLTFGTKIEASKLAELPWPKQDLPDGAFAHINDLLADGHRVAALPIDKNEPVLLSKLSGPDGRATLSNLLSPGMRAATIRIDEIAGVGGFITPGDHVDIISTRQARAAGGAEGGSSGGDRMISEVILSDVKVLSVGQGLDQHDTAPKVAHSVTVEVDAAGAKKIAEARAIGHLSLSLRSVLDAKDQNGMSITDKVAQSFGTVGTDLIKTSSTVKEKPVRSFTTVVVTRGIDQGKAYDVLTEPDDPEGKPGEKKAGKQEP
jgi:pilus assembly protein CpaB